MQPFHLPRDARLSTLQIFNQHCDAKELAALYISSGVPIYPRSLGHSYHTLVWRMRIEALEMQALSKTPGDVVVVENESNEAVPGPIDRFFAERYVTRVIDGMDYSMSYLEEKSLYMLNAAKQSNDGNGGLRGIARRMTAAPNHVAARPGLPQHHLPHQHGNDRLHHANLNGQAPHVSHLSRLRSLEVPSGHAPGRGLMKSKSHSDFRSHDPKVLVKVHRHLLDQHLLGRSCVDDKDGAMITAPINLGADFFHPIFKVRKHSFLRNLIPAQTSHVSFDDDLGSGEPLRTTDRGSNVLNDWAARGDMIVDRVAESGAGAFGHGTSLVETTDSDSTAAEGIFEPSNRGTDALVAATRRGEESAPMYNNLNPTVPRDGTILVNVDLDVYSTATTHKECDTNPSKEWEVRSQLRSRFAFYQRRFEDVLGKQDSHGFDESLLDFWDEFLPQTAGIHYFDRYTAVPRISCLEQFLTKPCPKAIGVLQCEIERIKVGPKKKGVNMKGRFFPTYEYRLFVRHRPPDTLDDSEPPRRDTVLMMAKNKGRKQFETDGSCASNKKGANNYFLYLPDRDDVERHCRSVNGIDMPSNAIVYNGADSCSMPLTVPTLMGRLQSNFIGTEFQIFRPHATKKSSMKSPPTKSFTTSLPSGINSASGSEDEKGYDSGGASIDNATSSRRKGRFARLSLRRSTAGNSSEPTTITEAETPVRNPVRRSRSSGDMNLGGRRIRISRRAIANNSDETVVHCPYPAPSEMEDGAITYTANLLGSRPRIMDVCIPKVSPEGVSGAEWKKYLDNCVQDSDGVGSNRMLNHLKQIQQRMENEDRTLRPTIHADPHDESDDYSPPEDFGLLALQNRPPWWNIELGSFVLNFGGRVSVASVKNFQLCDRNDQDYIMLQFGRIQGRHSFTMDFRHPLTAVQAFAIAISSLQSKLSLG